MLFPLHCSLMTPTEPQFQGEATTVTLICHSQGILSFHQHSQCPVSAGSCSLLLHPNIQGPNSPHSKDFTKPTRPSPAFVGHSHSCNGTSASQATPAGPPPVTFSRAHCQKYHHCPQPPASAALSQRRSRNVKGVHCGILYFLLLRIFELLLFHGPIWGLPLHIGSITQCEVTTDLDRTHLLPYTSQTSLLFPYAEASPS